MEPVLGDRPCLEGRLRQMHEVFITSQALAHPVDSDSFRDRME